MKKIFFVQMATTWLVIAVVIFDVMNRNSIITMAAELFSLAVAMALMVRISLLSSPLFYIYSICFFFCQTYIFTLYAGYIIT